MKTWFGLVTFLQCSFCLRKYWSIVCAGDISTKRGVWDGLWTGGSNPWTCYAGEDRRSATSHCADQQNGRPHSQLGCGKVAYVKIKTITVFMLNEQECNSQSFRAPKCCTILLRTTAAHSWDHNSQCGTSIFELWSFDNWRSFWWSLNSESAQSQSTPLFQSRISCPDMT